MLSRAQSSTLFPYTTRFRSVVRGVDPLSIEDASAIIINLGAIDVGKNRYLGIAGRSDAYPTGRWVTWESHDGTQLPPDYDSEAIEYEIGGKQANPLSWLAATNEDMEIPEYPVTIFKGGICDTAALTPITDSLYLDSKEFDVAASHTLSKSQEGITGTTVITRELTSSHSLPRTLSSVVGLEPGQDAKKMEGHSSGAVDRSEEHTSALQSHSDLVCRLLLEKNKKKTQKKKVGEKDCHPDTHRITLRKGI